MQVCERAFRTTAAKVFCAQTRLQGSLLKMHNRELSFTAASKETQPSIPPNSP
jgi:hypothetical protein